MKQIVNIYWQTNVSFYAKVLEKIFECTEA